MDADAGVGYFGVDRPGVDEQYGRVVFRQVREPGDIRVRRRGVTIRVLAGHTIRPLPQLE
jgi:hypothetical protein